MALRLTKILGICVASRRRLFTRLLALILLLPLLLLLAAPAILSTNLAQYRLKSILSSALHGPVNWSSLQLSWTQGLQLRNLSIGPADGTLRQASLASLDCRPGFGFGARPGGSFGFDLDLHLRGVTLELVPVAPALAAELPADAEEKLDPLTALARGLHRFVTLNWPLPFDLRVDMGIAPINLNYRDDEQGRRLNFNDGEVQVKIPSLEGAPVKVSLNGTLEADGQTLGPLRLATEIAGLVSPSGRIIPSGAFLSILVDLPGLSLSSNGNLKQGEGLQSELRLDLPLLQGAAAPLLPTTLPDLGGNLLATLHAEIDKEENLVLSSTLAGQSLQVDQFGPLDFNLGQQIRSDHRRQLVTLGGGVLMIPHLLEANWEARVEEPVSPQRRVSATLHHLSLDLDQAQKLAAPLLPANGPQLGGGELQLRDLDLQLRGEDGEGEMNLAQAGMTLRSFRLGEAALDGVTLIGRDLNVPLHAYFPASAGAEIEWSVAAGALGGAQPLEVRALEGSGRLRLASLHKDREGRLQARGGIDHQLRIKSAEAAGLAQIASLTNDLRLDFALLADGTLRAEDFAFETAVGALRVTTAAKKMPPLPLRQSLRMTGMELHPGEKFPRIEKVVLSITSPDLIKVEAEGGLTPERLLTLNAQTALDLSRLMPLARPLLPAELILNGKLSNDLHLIAVLPDRPLPAGQAPLRTMRTALAPLREMTATLQLDNVEVRLPLTEGLLHLGAIQTSRPLTLRSRNGGDDIELGGAVAFDLRQGSRFNAQPLPAAQGRITLEGELRHWDRAFLGETVVLEPLGVAVRSELTVTGLAALLDQPLPPSPATLLQRLDATLFSELDLHLRPGAPTLLPGMVVSGKTFAGSRVDLRGGDSLRLVAYADIEDLALKVTDGPQLQGLKAHLNLERALRIRSTAPVTTPWSPFSTSLVSPLPPPMAATTAGERRRLHDDLRGSIGGERDLSIQALTLPAGPLPLHLSDLEAEIATGTEVCGLNFLQAELLGGTLRARALFDLSSEIPVLGVEALFTNLDLGRLDSTAAQTGDGEVSSSISGEGSLRLPLFSEQRPLLENLGLSARLRKIGAQSFDKALASLDPYERNEAIMAQRQLLRLGRLEAVEVQASDGAISLSGAVSSRGISLTLPKIERLRLADLPVQEQLSPLLNVITTARSALEIARAGTIQLDAQGAISLLQEDP